MKFKIKLVAISLFLTAIGYSVMAQNNIIDEVAWVVGDQPIFKSEIEEQYLQLQSDRIPVDGNPYCVIPEELAKEKLFLHQAKIDTIEASNSTVQQAVDNRINYAISNLGSKEKVEELFGMPISELREKWMNTIRDQYTVQQVQLNLTKNVKITPSDVRKYYNSIPKDSLPFIPKKVEVEIITLSPVIPQQEIDEVKARLRDYAQKVNNGEADFATLAILYSEDTGSSVYGGEIGYKGRAELVSEYAAAAFNLNDSKKVSKIVETEFGYHIIQLIDKNGDRINTRHILLRPKVSQKDLDSAMVKLDTVRKQVLQNKYTFEDAAYISEDKDSKNNHGLMLNQNNRTNLFEMSELPSEIGKIVDKMNIGDISEPFIMMNQSTNRQQVAIVKLTKRIEGHKADLAEDFQTLKDLCENHEKAEIIEKWVKEKQRTTYVHIEEGWKNCEFKYNWLTK